MKKILIIEDNTEVRENLSEILELDGYQCFTAENGKIGVEQALEHKPDLIICDVMMPVLDGFGVLKIVNKNPDLMHIPFMFLTAKAEKSDFRKGMGLGADDYISKPFDDVELLEAIEIRLKKGEELNKIRETTEASAKTFYNENKATSDFESFISEYEIRKYNKKDIIFEIAQYPRWVYFVKSGLLKSFQTNDYGKELITHFINESTLFGYEPLLVHGKYLENVTAVSDSEVILVPLEDFQKFLFSNQDYNHYFIKSLCKTSGYYQNQLLNFAYSSVRKKVANSILELRGYYEDGNITLNRTEMASFAGIAKETLIRTLSDFKSENLIEIHDHSIEISDEIGLINMQQ